MNDKNGWIDNGVEGCSQATGGIASNGFGEG